MTRPSCLISTLIFTGLMFTTHATAEARVVFPDDAGVIDVTQPPYNAKGDGVTDDTEAIKAALHDHNKMTSLHRVSARTIYFPAGTYLVSDTLVAQREETGDQALNAVRFVGQGKGQTTIRLKDNAGGFSNPGEPRPVLRTGNDNGQGNAGYANYVQHMTIHTGQGNPGAGGVYYDVANVGAMQDVRIVSGDPQHRGVYGLGIFTTSGLGYVKRVEIEGFNHGIHVENTVNNIVFEHIQLTRQRDAAIYNEGKLLSFRGLTVRGPAPLLRTQRPQAATFFFEVDARGTGGGPAFVMRRPSFVYLRDANLTGYSEGARFGIGDGAFEIPMGEVDEWWSHQLPKNQGTRSLRLPIRETPEHHEADLSRWVNVTSFGATPNDDSDDDAPAIQAALDHVAESDDKSVVYFPYGSYTIEQELVVRDGVRKVDFMYSILQSSKNDGAQVRVRQSEGQAVNLEYLYRRVPFVHDSDGTLVIRNHSGSHRGPFSTSDRATGDLFIENVGPHAATHVQNGVHAWLRAVNREKLAFTNDGAVVWFYGDNIETMLKKSGPPHVRTRVRPIKTINGGITEYLAGCLDPLWAEHSMQDGPLFVTVDSTLFANGAGEVRKRGSAIGYWPYIARAMIDGEETRLLREDVIYHDEGEGAWPKRWLLPMYLVEPKGGE